MVFLVTFQQLQEKANRVEALVDTVVEVHHNSFNKAIQNYSQILKLFTESTVYLSNIFSHTRLTGFVYVSMDHVDRLSLQKCCFAPLCWHLVVYDLEHVWI